MLTYLCIVHFRMKKNSLRNNLPPILCRVSVFLEYHNRNRLFFITVMNHNTNDISQFCSMKRIKGIFLKYRSPSRHFSRHICGKRTISCRNGKWKKYSYKSSDLRLKVRRRSSPRSNIRI